MDVKEAINRYLMSDPNDADTFEQSKPRLAKRPSLGGIPEVEGLTLNITSTTLPTRTEPSTPDVHATSASDSRLHGPSKLRLSTTDDSFDDHDHSTKSAQHKKLKPKKRPQSIEASDTSSVAHEYETSIVQEDKGEVFLLLENVLLDFHQPCVMDMKMGMMAHNCFENPFRL